MDEREDKSFIGPLPASAFASSVGPVGSAVADLGPRVVMATINALPPDEAPTVPPKPDAHADVFPHDSPVARCMVSVSMARMDIGVASWHAGQTVKNEDADFLYFTRLTIAHLHEALWALGQYENEFKEVRHFKTRLPQEARDALKEARRCGKKVAGAIYHGRQYTFHYPYPGSRGKYNSDELLRGYLREAGHIAVDWGIPGLPMASVSFAQMAGHMLAFGGHSTDAKELSEQTATALRGAVSFIDFADAALDTYTRLRREGKL
jgi:hypothetical protein